MFIHYLLVKLFAIQTELPTGASDTLKELSPWAYVIVTLALAFCGIFLKLYLSEKKAREATEKEYREYAISTVSDQISVSKDVIALVTDNKEDIKDALKVHGQSDLKVENILTHIKNQLERIENLVTSHNRN